MRPPGRVCPPHYGYSPRVFARAPDRAADTLYAIGGLYGNPLALDAIDALAAVSYRDRIVHGPAFTVDHALGRDAPACSV